MLPPAQVLAHPSVCLCGGGWLFFVAENAVLSENRQVFIDRLGDRGYKSCYGLLSTCSLASVAYGLWRHGPGPRIRTVGPPSLAIGSALTCVGLVGAFNLAPALANPLGDDFTGCPLDLKAVRAEKATDVVGLERVTRCAEIKFTGAFLLNSRVDHHAIDATPARWRGSVGSSPLDGASAAMRSPRNDLVKNYRVHPTHWLISTQVTRHPQFWSLGFLGLGCAAMTPFAGTAAAALGFPLVALVNGTHLDSRHRRGMGGSLSVEREAKTSGVPFVALLRGRQPWAPLLDELKPVNSVLAMGASAAVMAAFVAT